jgi:molecular chaperone DnaK (HSP70)
LPFGCFRKGTRGAAPNALLVAYPDGQRPSYRELLQSGIALAVYESEALNDFPALCARANGRFWKRREQNRCRSSMANGKNAFAFAAAAKSNFTGEPDRLPAINDGDSDPVTNTATVLAPGQTCLHCKRWRPAPEDKFCAWCGSRLIVLRCDPAALDFRTDRAEAERRGLTLHNHGINTLFLSLEVQGSPEVRQRFTILPERKYGAWQIQGGAAESLTVIFDGAGIQPGVDYSAALQIHTNFEGELEIVPLRVERPPSAYLILPCDQQLVYGDPPTLNFSIRNTGGGVLELSTLKLHAPGQPVISSLSETAQAGAEAVVNVPLDVEKFKAGEYVARGEVEFANHEARPFAIPFTFTRPARLQLETEELLLQVYNIGRRRHQGVKFVNPGNETLTLKGQPKSDAPWLEGYCRNATVLKNQEGYIDIFVDARKLPPGRHEGKVLIESNGHEKSSMLRVQLTVSELKALEEPISIDFGTSISCAATVIDGVPRLIDLNPSSQDNSLEGNSLPSVVFFEENFFPIVGKEAKEKAQRDRNAAVTSVKRLLGERKTIKVRGKDLTPVEVTTEVFREILSEIERSKVAEGSPANALLTVPADISDEQIKGVLQAVKAAGLDVDADTSDEYLLDEPSAAALYYIWKSRQPQQSGSELLFIYDFGAGTLDCSLVQISSRNNNTNIKVLSTAGNRRLGGDDIDIALAQFMARKLAKAQPGFDPHPILATEAELNKQAVKDRIIYRQWQTQRVEFKEAAEQVKIELSGKETAQGNFPLGNGKYYQLEVTRPEFEQLLEPFLAKSNLVVQGCCHLAGITNPQHVHTLLHSGRGSMVPKIRDSVRTYFPGARDRSDVIEAKQCVALGAAWWAYIKNLPGSDLTFERVGKILPNTICYSKVEGVVEQFEPIFEAGETFPAEKHLSLQERPNRSKKLKIFEKRFGMDQGRPRRRQSVKLPPKPDGQYDCTFRLNVNRILEVVVGDSKLEIEPADDEDMAGEEAS